MFASTYNLDHYLFSYTSLVCTMDHGQNMHDALTYQESVDRSYTRKQCFYTAAWRRSLLQLVACLNLNKLVFSPLLLLGGMCQNALVAILAPVILRGRRRLHQLPLIFEALP
jgi:hypothetical protein